MDDKTQTALPEQEPWTQASDEPLSIIEVNECASNPWQLATMRFRRAFNEIRALQAALAAERERCALIVESFCDGSAEDDRWTEAAAAIRDGVDGTD